jgi:hypothetical protein
MMRKLHSIHLLPDGRGFSGNIEARAAKYRFTFSPNNAAVVNGKVVLRGSVAVKTPNGQTRKIDNAEATLLATQSSVFLAPPMPRLPSLAVKPVDPATSPSTTFTEATGDLGSIGMMYLKLSTLNGRTLGVPFDLSSVQLNARFYSTSKVERELHWLYSALERTISGGESNEEAVSGYLAEINRLLKA